MTNLPTVKQLRYFVALEKHKHFGKAAGASFVSQSAFSTAIKELEKLLDVQLVDRTNKTVTITSMGKEIAAQSRQCIRDIEHLTELASAGEGPLVGRLNLGIIPTIAPFMLPKIMPALRKNYPDLQLYLREDTTLASYAQLMTGELDLILIALPYKLSNIEVMPLYRDQFFLACHEQTQWLDPENYSLNKLKPESILLLEDGHCLRDHALSACKIRNQDTVSRFNASSLMTLIEMVNSDLGITYLTEMSNDSSMLQNTNIKTYPLSPNSFREIGLAWRKGSAYGNEFRELGEFFKSVCDK